MKNISRKEIMKRAHEIARTCIGDYYARLSLALRQAWMEAKTVVTAVINPTRELIKKYTIALHANGRLIVPGLSKLSDKVRAMLVAAKPAIIAELKQINTEKEEAARLRISNPAIEAARKAKFELAKETGEPVLLRRWSTGCCDRREECSLDIHYELAMPDGSIKHDWNHTW